MPKMYQGSSNHNHIVAWGIFEPIVWSVWNALVRINQGGHTSQHQYLRRQTDMAVWKLRASNPLKKAVN